MIVRLILILNVFKDLSNESLLQKMV
jgi:hypothetical protein